MSTSRPGVHFGDWDAVGVGVILCVGGGAFVHPRKRDQPTAQVLQGTA